ncbi:hypothetical protein L9F63_020001, partial [Diploptera punctata]
LPSPTVMDNAPENSCEINPELCDLGRNNENIIFSFLTYHTAGNTRLMFLTYFRSTIHDLATKFETTARYKVALKKSLVNLLNKFSSKIILVCK